jgi:hypothetical protein
MELKLKRRGSPGVPDGLDGDGGVGGVGFPEESLMQRLFPSQIGRTASTSVERPDFQGGRLQKPWNSRNSTQLRMRL